MKLLNFMQLLDEVVNVNSDCKGLDVVIRIIKNGLFPILWIGIPIILIVLGTLDLGKAVISSDEKEVKAAQSRLLKRCIYAVAVFFIVTIVQLVFDLVAKTASNGEEKMGTWWKCWNSISQN